MPSETSTVHGDQSVEELRRELAEAREQQVATAEILRVVSRSPMDLQRVFADIARAAARLCDYVAIFQVDGNVLRLVAHEAPIPGGTAGPLTMPLTRGTVAGRAVLDRRRVQVADLQTEIEEYPEGSAIARRLGHHTTLAVPLIHAGVAIGVINNNRVEARQFSDKQIALLEAFADQAVIAIENARLFEAEQARTRELSLSLERQIATSEILRVISSTPTNVQPVFDAIVRRASSLCGGEHAIVTRYDGMLLHLAAQHNPRPGAAEETAKLYPQAPRPTGSISGRAVLDCTVVHFPDIEAETMEPGMRDAYRRMELRAVLCVPMIHEGQPIGVIAVSRGAAGPFTDSQIDLLKTFASQAVIAIENARLFEEIAQKSRELEVASQHKSQFVANMSHELRTPLAAILGYAELMQEGFYEPQGPKSTDALARIRSNGKHLLGLINTVLDVAKIESGNSL